jgi:alanine racemase
VLYGSSPDYPTHTADHWGLQPAMSLTSQIIGTQQLHAGDTVGYGSTFTAEGDLRLGVVACGYADGYPRLCGTGTPVLVNGVRTRLLGRVSMDMVCVDLTPVPDAQLGSEVVLWGRSPRHGSVLSIDEVAAAAGTVGYELMCAVAARVPVVSGEDALRP